MQTSRITVIPVAAAIALGVTAGPAAADHCVNANTNNQGLQVVIDAATGEPSYLAPGVRRRVERGLIDVATGDGFAGPLGIDFDGDGTADVVSLQVTPWNAIPEPALVNGATCHGIVDIATFLSVCLPG